MFGTLLHKSTFSTMNFMKSKYRPSISDGNVASEFRSPITLTYPQNFKTQCNKKKSHKYFYLITC